jgi:hypothetical protein
MTMLALPVLLLNGCSFYYSSESSFKTLVSPSTSSMSMSKSSGSSSSSGKHAQYASDVSDAAAQYARQDGSMDLPAFFARVSDLASKKGLSDWENDADTYEAIGKGLNRSSPDDATYQRLRDSIASSDVQRANVDKGAGRH